MKVTIARNDWTKSVEAAFENENGFKPQIADHVRYCNICRVSSTTAGRNVRVFVFEEVVASEDTMDFCMSLMDGDVAVTRDNRSNGWLIYAASNREVGDTNVEVHLDFSKICDNKHPLVYGHRDRYVWLLRSELSEVLEYIRECII